MSKDENEIGRNVARLLDCGLDDLRQSTLNRLQAARERPSKIIKWPRRRLALVRGLLRGAGMNGT